MIVTLRGRITDIQDAYIILDVNGVGYGLNVTSSVLKNMPAVGQELLVYTHLQVREDAMVLYGFSSWDERRLFQQIISVTGIGPKTGLGILSTVTPIEFVRAVEQRQLEVLTQIPGIGKKTAERLVLELKDKFTGTVWEGTDEDIIPIAPGGILQDARDALIALGYSASESEYMVQTAHAALGDTHDLQELLKQALASNTKQRGDRGWRRNG